MTVSIMAFVIGCGTTPTSALTMSDGAQGGDPSAGRT
jgi:hypothetical protein